MPGRRWANRVTLRSGSFFENEVSEYEAAYDVALYWRAYSDVTENVIVELATGEIVEVFR